jgi:hypothetical protein
MPPVPPRSFFIASALACVLCAFVVHWSVGQYAKGALYGEALAFPPIFVLLVSWLPHTLARGATRELRIRAAMIYTAALLLITVIARL